MPCALLPRQARGTYKNQPTKPTVSVSPPTPSVIFPLVSDAFELGVFDGGQADRERPTLLQKDRETPQRLYATTEVQYPFGTFRYQEKK